MDEKVLKQKVDQGLSSTEISNEVGIPESNVRYYLKKYDLQTNNQKNGRKTWTDEQMLKAISNNKTVSDVLREIGLTVRPGNFRTFWKFVENNSIDTSHFDRYSNNKKIKPKKTLNEVLVKNSYYSRSSLKRRLLKEGLLKNECEICGQKGEHNGKPLTMVLDHINGIGNDNRLENLRMLCPNCNSQTDTFCSRGPSEKFKCPDCGNKKSKKAKLCFSCSKNKPKKVIRKVKRPTKKQLEKMIEEMSWVAIGKKYGVSDNPVRKWAKAYEII